MTSPPRSEASGAPPTSESLLEEAVTLARLAGDSTLGLFRDRELAVEQKIDGTPVTEADREAERTIRARLAETHPDDAIIGEEFGSTEGTSGRRWIVDPIDGTKAFTRGVPLYSTLVAVDDGHGPAVGVVHLPALGETVFAGRGLGCFVDGSPARVSDCSSLDCALLTTSGYEHWDERTLLSVRRSGMQLRTWGDAYGYTLVATGRAEAMVDPEAALWDLAPMLVIVPEAGGRFTDHSGRCTAEGGSGLATNGRLHDAVLPLVTNQP